MIFSIRRSVITTEEAPAAVRPYSQAMCAGDIVCTAGQVAPIPTPGELVEGGIEEQTRQVLRNLSAVLEAAGSSPDHVVKTTVFLKDIQGFKAMNHVYAQFFGSEPPARSTVQVAALPLGGLVEIEAIAVKRQSHTPPICAFDDNSAALCGFVGDSFVCVMAVTWSCSDKSM